MEKLHHELWIVTVVNQLFGPAVASLLGALGFHRRPGARHPRLPGDGARSSSSCITALCLLVRSRLSVENPGKLQIVLEDVVGVLKGMLTENIGPKGPQYLPLIGTVGLFIFTAQHDRQGARASCRRRRTSTSRSAAP